MAEDSKNDEVDPLVPQESLETQPEDGQSGTTETPQVQPTATDEATRLEELQADVRNQDELEKDITRQADKILAEQADERDNRRLERTRHEKE
ncbi:hypothetical protein PHISCL_01983 [Aspergillus sclerotialis]|uniref:Uncharacterized protein n=1 Tax=Aspergillus sclerotialis TaxID=2070753 RepID=A0A3A2ZRK5_9EURO|nr:hypothetical protein PHISCL_01983 [Aspergillus sclerotialis]